MLVRDWRGGELGVLVVALILAVGVVSGISAFTTRLQTALEQESHRFLAADSVVRSGRPLPAEWLDEAGTRGLAHVTTLLDRPGRKEVPGYPADIVRPDDAGMALTPGPRPRAGVRRRRPADPYLDF